MDVRLGKWWIPANPQYEVLGALITEGDDFLLEIEEDFSTSLQAQDGTPFSGYHLEIHGEAEGIPHSLLRGYRTSSGMSLKHRTFGSSTSSSAYRASWLVRGAHVNHEVASTSVLVRFDGLQDWSAFSGIRAEYTQLPGQPITAGRISIDKQETVTFGVGTVRFSIEHTVSTDRPHWGYSAQSDSTLRLDSMDALGIDEWLSEWIEPFIRFVQICTGTGGHIAVLAFPSESLVPGGRPFYGWHFSPSTSRRLPVPGTPSPSRDQRQVAYMGSFDLDTHLPEWYKLYQQEAIRPAMDGFIDVRIGSRPFTNAERTFVLVRCLEQMYSVEAGNARFSKGAYDKIKKTVREMLIEDGVSERSIGDIINGIKHLREDSLKAKLREAFARVEQVFAFDDPLIEGIIEAAAKIRNDFAHTGSATNPMALSAVTSVLECLVLAAVLIEVGLNPPTVATNMKETTPYRNAEFSSMVYRDAIIGSG